MARWRTLSATPIFPLQVQALCERGGARASRGPGDDWACDVTLPRRAIINGSALTLEVTVRANGCYTAEAPPSIVGPLLLQDARGHTFLNPLFAFDGCFGTA